MYMSRSMYICTIAAKFADHVCSLRSKQIYCESILDSASGFKQEQEILANPSFGPPVIE